MPARLAKDTRCYAAARISGEETVLSIEINTPHLLLRDVLLLTTALSEQSTFSSIH